jgi:hypothetical protein
MNDPAIQSVLAAQQGALQSQIQVALAAKQLTAIKEQGAAIVQLIEAAAATSKAMGQGAHFDRQA